MGTRPRLKRANRKKHAWPRCRIKTKERGITAKSRLKSQPENATIHAYIRRRVKKKSRSPSVPKTKQTGSCHPKRCA